MQQRTEAARTAFGTGLDAPVFADKPALSRSKVEDYLGMSAKSTINLPDISGDDNYAYVVIPKHGLGANGNATIDLHTFWRDAISIPLYPSGWNGAELVAAWISSGRVDLGTAGAWKPVTLGERYLCLIKKVPTPEWKDEKLPFHTMSMQYMQANSADYFGIYNSLKSAEAALAAYKSGAV